MKALLTLLVSIVVLSSFSFPAKAAWVTCASEGGYCAFSGTKAVRYGALTQFVNKSFTNGVLCTNQVFGDPAYGVRKICAYDDASTGDDTPPPPSGSWVYCASEGQNCSFSGTREVRYGTDAKNVTKSANGGILCDNSVFGDPAYGIVKSCWYSTSTSSAPAPTPVPPKPIPVPEKPTPGYSKTQIFQLGNPTIYTAQGQNFLMRLRYYGVPYGYVSKPFIHLIRADGSMISDNYYDSGNHYWQIPSNTWNGYVEFQYQYTVSAKYVPPGTYRIQTGLYQGVAPYAYNPNLYDCNGVQTLDLSGKGCVVGTLVVSAGNGTVNDSLWKPQSMYVMPIGTWSP